MKKIIFHLLIQIIKLLVTKKKVNNPSKLNYFDFLRNTSIATRIMMVKRDIIGNIKFTNTKICEDFF